MPARGIADHVNQPSIPLADRLLLRQLEAAQMLSISTRHLRRLTRNGVIQSIGHGRNRRYRVEDLRAYACSGGTDTYNVMRNK